MVVEESIGQVVAEQLQSFLMRSMRHMAMQSSKDNKSLHRASPLTFDSAIYSALISMATWFLKLDFPLAIGA